MNGIQEVDGSIPFGSTIRLFRRLRVEVLLLLVVAALAVPGWIAILVRPPLRNAFILETSDTHVVPKPDEQVNLASTQYGTYYTASTAYELANADVAYLSDGRFDRPQPRWSSLADTDPWVTVHFARPSAIEGILVVTAPVTDKRQQLVTAMRARCDAGAYSSLSRLEVRRFGADWKKTICNAVTFQFGHLDKRAIVGALEIIVHGTQPEQTDHAGIPRPAGPLPAIRTEGNVP